MTIWEYGDIDLGTEVNDCRKMLHLNLCNVGKATHKIIKTSDRSKLLSFCLLRICSYCSQIIRGNSRDKPRFKF